MANSKRARRIAHGQKYTMAAARDDDRVLPDIQRDPWMTLADTRVVREMLMRYNFRSELDLANVHRTPRRAREVRR